jgi:hypothetical protein
MLKNISVASCAVQTKSRPSYEKFNINEVFPSINIKPNFVYTLDYHKKKVVGYKYQDEKAKRDTSRNVTDDDYETLKKMFETQKCYLCGEYFGGKVIPTLDRKNNKKGHSLKNCKPCCKRCNSLKSYSDDVQMIKLKVQLNKFAYANNLPMTLGKGDGECYRILRNGITGGLSNVHHKLNIADETKITKVKVNDKGKLEIVPTDHYITHCIGVDANSLYPSCFSSTYNPELIPYTGGRMYMPGKVTNFFKYETEKQKELA